jgi:hypothetical protein
MPSFRREHEGGLGKIELACNLLHLPIRKTCRFGQHSQLIAAEANFGKDVANVITVAQLIYPPYLR